MGSSWNGAGGSVRREELSAEAAAAAGFDAQKLAEAVAFARSAECKWPRSMYTDQGLFIGCAYVEDKPPYNQPLGPVSPRGGAAGLVLRHGRVAASWGDTDRVDMTFSIAKSLIALVTGIAVDTGVIRSIDDTVGDVVRDGGFDDPHNAAITWRHLLEQTSEWHGELFDRPDSVDWHRLSGPDTYSNLNKGSDRALQPPGTHFEYNDVRVNRLSLALLRALKQPLPEVLRTAVMEPIAASQTWRWEGYANSTVEVDGRPMVSVPGGGHWGGGVFISAADLARLGELVRNDGAFGGRQILSADWIAQMLTPSAVNPAYGLLWWLNTNGTLYPSASHESVFALGGGTNLIWIDRPRGLVVAARWVEKTSVDTLIGKIMRSLST